MNNRSYNSSLASSFLIKMVIILIAVILYTYAVANHKMLHSHNKSLGVCVFDIDFTLNCKGAYAAVDACKNAGFDLAINTARNKNAAMKMVYDGSLLEKGFDPTFIEVVKLQEGLAGPLQYKETWSINNSIEQTIQAKSYGMRNISDYYNIRTDDIESRRVILFDDFLHNIVQMQPNRLDPYNSSSCIKDEQGLCYSDPKSSPKNVSFPRNWKIYRSKWVGYLCTRWDRPEVAAQDAEEAIYSVINNDERQLLNNEKINKAEYLFNE